MDFIFDYRFMIGYFGICRLVRQKIQKFKSTAE